MGVQPITRDAQASKRAQRAAFLVVALAGLAISTLGWTQSALQNAKQPDGTTKSVGSDVATADTKIEAHNNSFIIGNDDVLSIDVWKEPGISRSLPVRSDGKISLPLVGELQATGTTPLKLERDIADRLKNYIDEPEVTVIVQQINSQKFNILGQVNHPGSFLLSNATTVLDAIALAGGFRDFAKQKSIYVLRQNADGTQIRIHVNYKQLIKGEDPSQNAKLQPHDTVVVP